MPKYLSRLDGLHDIHGRLAPARFMIGQRIGALHRYPLTAHLGLATLSLFFKGSHSTLCEIGVYTSTKLTTELACVGSFRSKLCQLFTPSGSALN